MPEMKRAVFGGGCFWCTEAIFQRLRGVESVRPGYAGGAVENPSYEQVSGGDTGHAEVIDVEYDPETIDYETLLAVFFAGHDPTQLNRQGADVGEQYRSVIFYTDEKQKQGAEKYIEKLKNDQVFDGEVVTKLEPLDNFYEAEGYHKNYYNKNNNKPYCQLVIDPKINKLRKEYKHLLKE